MATAPDHSALDAALAAQDTALQALRAPLVTPVSAADYDPLPDLIAVARTFRSMCASGQIKSVRNLAAANRALAAIDEL